MNVFLTGASSGIGEALAATYAGRGAALGLFARHPSAPAGLAARLEAGRYAWYSGDVRDPAARRAAAENFAARFGPPDIVIANAGISIGTSTEFAADNAPFRDVLETNVLGVVHTFQPFVAAMKARGYAVEEGMIQPRRSATSKACASSWPAAGCRS